MSKDNQLKILNIPYLWVEGRESFPLILLLYFPT